MSASERPLAELFDVALLDLDGVVYVGPNAVPHAAPALREARAEGMRLAFVTNNAARTPQTVARHLTDLGIAATPDEVITSAQAAAHYLADRLPTGSAVLVVGTDGLVEALRERGLRPVFSADDHPAAVVQGYSPTVDWPLLAEGAIAIDRGLLWVATNVDPTVPSPRGPLPGNGSLVAALRNATGAEPIVTGKPQPTMHLESVQRSGAQRPIVVGDRLDTDIEGANAVGCASLLVLTGVTGARDLLAAEPRHRPTFVGADLRDLLTAHPGVVVAGDAVRCSRWEAAVDSGRVRLGSTGDSTGDAGRSADPIDGVPLDALRALCVAAWRIVDDGGRAPQVIADDDAASDAVAALHLGESAG